MRDIGASVLARLKDKAQDSGMSAQVQLRLFCQEEFMRRLALSDYADNLVLKGGLLLFALSGFESRATIDIDFLLKCLPGDAGSVQRIVEKIVSTSTGNDFITFEMQNFREISPHRKYKGISFQLVGRIKNTQTPFNVDFGIGDVVIPRAEKRRIPTQLGDFEAPEIGTMGGCYKRPLWKRCRIEARSTMLLALPGFLVFPIILTCWISGSGFWNGQNSLVWISPK